MRFLMNVKIIDTNVGHFKRFLKINFGVSISKFHTIMSTNHDNKFNENIIK